MRAKMVLKSGQEKFKYPLRHVKFQKSIPNELIDLKVIGNTLFLLEGVIQEGISVEQIEVPTYEIYGDEAASIIQDLLSFLFKREIKIRFIKNPQRRFEGDGDLGEKVVCLFSGGIDSFAGILNAKKEFGDIVGSFSLHYDHAPLEKKITFLKKNILKKNDINIIITKNPAHGSGIRYMRGLLYLIDALLVGQKDVIISECGTTMYQPQFAPFDEVTLTTHPVILKSVKDIVKHILGFSTKIIKPNEEMTKAEIVATSPEKENIRFTHSCWSTRFCRIDKTHCGSCYGCVTRKLALIVAGVEDTPYRRDVLLEEYNSDFQSSSLLALLRFSLDVISDFEKLPSYSRDIIEKYNKKELFERASLDVYAGLFLLEKDGRLRDKLFKKWLQRGQTKIGNMELEKRIEVVREGKIQPDFKIVL